MMTRARPLLFAAAILLLSRCARIPPEPPEPPPVPVASAPTFHRIDESIAAFERGDRDATYYNLAALWLECGSTDLAREALVIAIAAELDPTNSWSEFERAADLAAAFRGQRGDPRWKRSMAEALRAWAEVFGTPVDEDPPNAGSDAAPRAASPAPLLHAAVLKHAAPRPSDDCTAPPGYVSPTHRHTARVPAPAVVARILEVEATRLRLASDLADLGERLRDVADLNARLRDQELELERLRMLLKP